MEVDLDGALPIYKTEIIAAVEKCKALYPVLKNLIRRIYVTKMSIEFLYSFASCQTIFGRIIQYDIKLNIDAFGEPHLQEKLDSTVDSVNESIEDIIAHEIGHALSIFIILNKLHLKLDRCGKHLIFRDPIINHLLYYVIYRKYFKKFGKDKDQIEKMLGSYATHNIFELLPECFNYYFRLKRRGPLFFEKETYDFVSMVVTDYEKFIPKEYP